eukprot:1259100-Rhodomonas_salina.2
MYSPRYSNTRSPAVASSSMTTECIPSVSVTTRFRANAWRCTFRFSQTPCMHLIRSAWLQRQGADPGPAQGSAESCG